MKFEIISFFLNQNEKLCLKVFAKGLLLSLKLMNKLRRLTVFLLKQNMCDLYQFKFPSTTQLDILIDNQKLSNLTYNHDNLSGFDHDNNRIFLGIGNDVWLAAKQAMKQWAMSPDGWARIYYQNPVFTEGGIVVMCARVFGVWWLNASRILYVLDDDQHFGFAYGTLPNHVESGEELFQVLRNERDEIYYSITAFSRPRFWAVRWTYPLSRFFQKKFVKDSLQKMKKTTDVQIELNKQLLAY